MSYVTWLWRIRERWLLKLGRTFFGAERRVSTGITIEPALLKQLDDLRGSVPRSRILEELIKLFVANPEIIKPVEA